MKQIVKKLQKSEIISVEDYKFKDGPTVAKNKGSGEMYLLTYCPTSSSYHSICLKDLHSSKAPLQAFLDSHEHYVYYQFDNLKEFAKWLLQQ